MQYICELIDICKSYGNHAILDEFNLKICEGEMVAITGKSGSGKTTILNIMGMLENPDNGVVKLFGEESPSMNSSKANKLLRTKMSYLFQNYALIDNDTVNKNLEIPLIYAKKTKKEKKELKTVALEKVGLRSVSLQQKIHELSGGEQQRAAIARILLKPCELILADEPTGSLDDSNRNEIIQILKNLNKEGKTIVIVTHDPYVAQVCDRVIEL